LYAEFTQTISFGYFHLRSDVFSILQLAKVNKCTKILTHEFHEMALASSDGGGVVTVIPG
jgi:hypothetical protein